MSKVLALLLLSLLAACSADSARQADTPPAFAYPPAARIAQVDNYHGTRVEDPYRWLEQVDDTQTRQWITAENALAQPYLEGIPARETIKKRLTELWNHERYSLPVHRGDRYFYMRNDGLQNQSVLYVADGLHGQPRVLLDPNTLSKDATIALAEIMPSPDGKILAYSLSDGGTDWRTWHFRDVATGIDLPDVLRFIKFSLVHWTADSRTVYYTRYPLRADGSGDDSKQREVYWHRMGTAQTADERVFKVVDHPTRNPYVQVSDDFRYLVIWLYDGSQRTGIYYRTLGADGAPSSEVVRLFDTWDADYEFVAEIDDTFYVRTTKDALNAQLIAVPATSAERKNWRVVIPEGEHALVETSIVGGRIFAQYLKDAHSVVRAFDLGGKALYDVKLPGLGQRHRLFRRREGRRNVFLVHRLSDAGFDLAPGRRERRGQSVPRAEAGRRHQRVRHRAGLLSQQRRHARADVHHQQAQSRQERPDAGDAVRLRRLQSSRSSRNSACPCSCGWKWAAPSRSPICAAARSTARPGTRPARSCRSRTCSTTSSPPRNG